MDAVQDYINIASKYNISPERFMFHDRVSNTEIPYWLKSFDLALAPFPNINHYAYYMSPLKIFEYMAAQIPIITTDLPSIKEILKHSENAWLVKPGDVEALVSGIQTLILDEDKSQLLVKNAAQEVTKYTWYNRAKLIIQNCQNLI